MLSNDRIESMAKEGRYVAQAKSGDEDLGPLQLLPGVWKNTSELNGRGWNMIALPFADPPFNYRLLMNQYNERLNFSIVDKGVPNRGIGMNGQTGETDQFVVTLDYDQEITQIAGDDRIAKLNAPVEPSGTGGEADGKVIHREPGLWLYMTNFNTDGIDIARLGSVPHGDSLLALGKSVDVIDGPPTIPPINGLPIGVSHDLNSQYLGPYKFYEDHPFKNLFKPVDATELLRGAVPGTVKKTTVLHVDSTLDHAGVKNIPFIVRQANAESITATFWIQEVEEIGPNGKPRIFLQYAQSSMLDFFGRRDGNPGLIKWPHVSINTMEKASEPEPENAKIEMMS